MTPYYEDESVTIYHGDALNVLLNIPDRSVDVFVMDPPYGSETNSRPDGQRGDRVGWMVGEFSNVLPMVLPELHRVGVDDAALYCFTSWRWMSDWVMRASPYFRMKGFLVWDKGRHSGSPGIYSWLFSWEGVYYGLKGPRKVRAYKRDVLLSKETGRREAMQKPVDIIASMIEVSSDPGQTVLDPFMGTGSTLLAAKRTGRKAIGIEIDERYCEIAAKRCAQDTLGLVA